MLQLICILEAGLALGKLSHPSSFTIYMQAIGGARKMTLGSGGTLTLSRAQR